MCIYTYHSHMLVGKTLGKVITLILPLNALRNPANQKSKNVENMLVMLKEQQICTEQI